MNKPIKLSTTPRFFILMLLLSFNLNISLAQKNKFNLKTPSDYIEIIKYYRYLNPDSAVFFVKIGIEKAIEAHDELGLASLLNQYGMIEDNAGKYQESKQNYFKAEAIFRKENNKLGLASTLIRLGVVEKRSGNYDKSLSYFFSALELSEQARNLSGILEARVVLSETYFDLEDYKNCFENLKLAEQIERKTELSNFSLNMYTSFGNYYIKVKQYDKAIEYINKGLPKSNKIEYNGLRIGLLKLLGVAYYEKGQTIKAVATLKEALSFAKQIKNVLREQSIMLALANIYEKNNPDTALIYLNGALEIVESHQMYRQEILVLNQMSNIYKSKNDFKNALSLTEKSYQLSEKIFYKDMSKQVSSLESAYELEKSNAQLIQLKLKNDKEAIVNNIILSIAITITLILGIILVYFFRARHLNQKLKKVNQRLEENNIEKDKFLSIVAHDIRSPLTSTISVLKFIANRELDDDTQDEIVRKLSKHCESSLEVLDKLLKWGQLQMKGNNINTIEFEPYININRNLGFLKDAASQKNITIALQLPENIIIKADPDQFDFVIRNLLANGIKFTPKGGLIKLDAEIEKDRMVLFKISDNGVGISEKRIDKLFEFSAVGTRGTSNEEGTSLGLLICKEFIDANNGTLKVESKLGVGTTFIFRLPGYIKEKNM